MKILLYVLIIPAIAIFSCGITGNTGNGPMQPGNLKSNFIKIRSNEAYILKTPKGAILRIDKNTFSNNGSDEVLVELKEAYTLHDMITGGLVTENNGKLLNSGGMLYINATINGEKAAILNRVKVSIPTNVYDDRMQLYKGEMKGDSLNWTSPVPLDTNAEFRQRLILGRKLFLRNCASCHKPTQDFTGPALAKARERSPDPEWAYRFIARTTIMIERDPYAMQLKRKYGSVMTSFPLLEKASVKAILDYCDNEAAANPFPLPATTPADEPCMVTDTVYVRKPDSNVNILSIPVSSPASFDSAFNSLKKEEEYNEGLRKGFTDPNYTTGMYDFEVNTLGWYNVDAEIEGYRGSALVRMQAKIINSNITTDDIHVYLFCPDKKLLSVAYDRLGDMYTFNKINGKVPLFLNDEAVIFAFTSKGEKVYYGISAFRIKAQQTVTILLKESTPDEMKSLISSNKIDGIRLDALKKEDTEIISRPCNETQGNDSLNAINISK